MKIIKVNEKKDIRRFAECGAKFSFQHNEGFIKNTASEMALWDPEKNFFFRQGGDAEAFIAVSGDDVCGRIAVMNHPYISENTGRTGMIGFFDCVDDQVVADALLGTACEWLKKKGFDKVVGPVNFTIWHDYRFMTKGFGSYILMGEPRNPKYYPIQWQMSGFMPEAHWTTYIYDKSSITPVPGYLAEHEDRFNRIGYQTIFMKGIPGRTIMKETYHLMMHSYRTFPFYTPLSEIEFLDHFSYMPSFINKSTSFFLKNPSGDMVGFGVQYKDLTPAITAMHGNSGLPGKIRFLLHKNTENVAIIAQGGTLPQYSREALELGNAHCGEPMSLGMTGLAKSLKYSLESGKYSRYAITLVRDQALHRKHIPKNTTETREYSLFSLNL